MPLLCRCGRVRVWAGAVRGPENSQQLADWYSLSHVVHGLLLFGALRLTLRRAGTGLRLAIATMIEAGWEILENSPVIIDRYRAETIS